MPFRHVPRHLSQTHPSARWCDMQSLLFSVCVTRAKSPPRQRFTERFMWQRSTKSPFCEGFEGNGRLFMWKKGHTLQVYAQKQSVNPDLHPSFLLCKIHCVVQSLINHFILTRMWLHWRYVKAWCVSSRHKGFYEIHHQLMRIFQLTNIQYFTHVILHFITGDL